VILREKIMEVWEGEKGRKVYGARKVWLELNSRGSRWRGARSSG